jgi:hypothetical protein
MHTFGVDGLTLTPSPSRLVDVKICSWYIWKIYHLTMVNVIIILNVVYIGFFFSLSYVRFEWPHLSPTYVRFEWAHLSPTYVRFEWPYIHALYSFSSLSHRISFLLFFIINICYILLLIINKIINITKKKSSDQIHVAMTKTCGLVVTLACQSNTL